MVKRILNIEQKNVEFRSEKKKKKINETRSVDSESFFLSVTSVTSKFNILLFNIHYSEKKVNLSRNTTLKKSPEKLVTH